MKQEKRIKKLEAHIKNNCIDAQSDVELSLWFKSHPEFKLFTQPKQGEEGMPEHLQEILKLRIDILLAKKNLPLRCDSLLKLSEDDFRLLKS
jgi:hypothetical protein